ncbi:UPF0749 protein YlxX [Pontibacillus salipaludis]|uniref:UPF0749 protein YlxX n=2 Tax=Pontibacillus salipaludis TaxID=1697394 RepID=A0ABQ1Q8F7_9BACI|nr:UPF0749 protein YlxX [Pontibacillus salipaludis]
MIEMNIRSKIIFSFVFALVGFMIAIQFQTTQEPKVRDTRDLWEVRTELQKQQKTQQELLAKERELNKMIAQYEGQSNFEKVETLNKSLNNLKLKAGLTEVKGAGLMLTVEPIFQDLEYAETYPTVSPSLLHQLINELNTYGAKDISIGQERITNLSPIRDVNGTTYVNNHPVPPLPIKIKVLAEDPEKLLNYMEVSDSLEMFVIENLSVSMEIRKKLTLPEYEQTPDLQYLETEDATETGET